MVSLNASHGAADLRLIHTPDAVSRACVATLLVAWMAVYPGVSLAADTLHFWVRAFIPAGTPTEAAGRCFKTDERSFSSAPDASARLTTELVLKVDGNSVDVAKADGRPFFRAGQSSQLNCQTHAVITSKTADVSSMKLGHPALADGVAQIVAAGSAANPLTPPVLSPSIDYDATLTWSVHTHALSVRFTVGRFPAFEAYAQMNDGPIKQLLAVAPDPGASPFALYDFGVGLNTRSFEVNKLL